MSASLRQNCQGQSCFRKSTAVGLSKHKDAFSHVLEEALRPLVLSFGEQYCCLCMVSRLGCLTCWQLPCWLGAVASPTVRQLHIRQTTMMLLISIWPR